MSVAELLMSVAALVVLIALALAVWRHRRLARRGNRPNIEHDG